MGSASGDTRPVRGEAMSEHSDRRPGAVLCEGDSATIEIRPADAGDLDAIVQIERDSFSAPWTHAMFEAELTGNPFGRTVVARLARPSQPRGPVVGYVCYWIVFDEVRLMTLAVTPEARRRGLGRRLVEHALAAGRQAGATRASLEVRVSNTAAQALYHGLGFRQIAVRPAYYATPVEDALILSRDPLSEG